jgi:NAD-dependent deacetylase
MHFNLLDSLSLLKKYLDKSAKIVFLTGSGISKESGIPTFRGKDGLWRKYDPTTLASISAFLENPKLVWEFYYYRQDLINKCHPNAAHLAISQIQIEKKDTCIITQNVDNLHQKAKSKNIIELHGNIFRTKCISCSFKSELKSNKGNSSNSSEALPRCNKCKDILKPGVILFGESLPSIEWNNAIEKASNCDIMFIVGTSLNVSPANLLPSYAKENKSTLVEINPESTWLSKSMDITLNGSAANILPKIYDLIKQKK